jgi:hypothetical protein
MPLDMRSLMSKTSRESTATALKPKPSASGTIAAGYPSTGAGPPAHSRIPRDVGISVARPPSQGLRHRRFSVAERSNRL